MPGLSKLSDKEFLRLFSYKQPIFIFTCNGPIVSVLSLLLTCIAYVGLSETCLIVLVAIIYLSGVQGIKILINLPLNNHIQKLSLEKLTNENLKNERLNFENKWNFFNNTIGSFKRIQSAFYVRDKPRNYKI